jgi:hypothetical protein
MVYRQMVCRETRHAPGASGYGGGTLGLGGGGGGNIRRSDIVHDSSTKTSSKSKKLQKTLAYQVLRKTLACLVVSSLVLCLISLFCSLVLGPRISEQNSIINVLAMHPFGKIDPKVHRVSVNLGDGSTQEPGERTKGAKVVNTDSKILGVNGRSGIESKIPGLNTDSKKSMANSSDKNRDLFAGKSGVENKQRRHSLQERRSSLQQQLEQKHLLDEVVGQDEVLATKAVGQDEVLATKARGQDEVIATDKSTDKSGVKKMSSMNLIPNSNTESNALVRQMDELEVGDQSAVIVAKGAKKTDLGTAGQELVSQMQKLSLTDQALNPPLDSHPYTINDVSANHNLNHDANEYVNHQVERSKNEVDRSKNDENRDKHEEAKHSRNHGVGRNHDRNHSRNHSKDFSNIAEVNKPASSHLVSTAIASRVIASRVLHKDRDKYASPPKNSSRKSQPNTLSRGRSPQVLSKAPPGESDVNDGLHTSDEISDDASDVNGNVSKKLKRKQKSNDYANANGPVSTNLNSSKRSNLSNNLSNSPPFPSFSSYLHLLRRTFAPYFLITAFVHLQQFQRTLIFPTSLPRDQGGCKVHERDLGQGRELI